MSTSDARPIHPCYRSIWQATSGAEFAVWANLTASSSSAPNLVTALASTLNVYALVDEGDDWKNPSSINKNSTSRRTGRLILLHSFSDLAGNICALNVLQAPSNASHHANDSLLLGFSGHARLAVVRIRQPSDEPRKNRDDDWSLVSNTLSATTLLDLTSVVQEHAVGAQTPLEQDLQVQVLQQPPGAPLATAAINCGGGVAVAVVQLHCDARTGIWSGSTRTTSRGTSTRPLPPYVLPLQALSRSTPVTGKSGSGGKGPTAANTSLSAGAAGASSSTIAPSIATGFGDILSMTFLTTYREPTLVLLHSDPTVGGWTGPERWGRPDADSRGCRFAMRVTACSITVPHQQSAVLWSLVVPADALALHSVPNNSEPALMLQCVSSLWTISSSGILQQGLAVNGWAEASLPSELLVDGNRASLLQANPWPFPKLSITLDGAKFTFLRDPDVVGKGRSNKPGEVSSPAVSVGFVSLREGQLYLLQQQHSNHSSLHATTVWSMWPLQRSVPQVGQVSHLISWPFRTPADNSSEKQGPTAAATRIGLLFVASRLGNSSLLGFALETTTAVPDAEKATPKLEQSAAVKAEQYANGNDDDQDSILRLEEEALYAPSVDAHLIPPSSDEDEVDDDSVEYQNLLARSTSLDRRKAKRPRWLRWVQVRSWTVLDTIASTGPLGEGVTGPISPLNYMKRQEDAESFAHSSGSEYSSSEVSFSSVAHVFPCGYGSSGGLAWMTVPGRDDRMLLSEVDCIHGKSLMCLPNHRLAILSRHPRHGGSKLFRLASSDGFSSSSSSATESKESDMVLDEIILDPSNNEFFVQSELLDVSEGLAAKGHDATTHRPPIIFLTQDTELNAWLIVVSWSEESSAFTVHGEHRVPLHEEEHLETLCPPSVDGALGLWACAGTTSRGAALLLVLNDDYESLMHYRLEPALCGSSAADKDGDSEMMDAGEEDEEVTFYKNGAVTAVDLFSAPGNLFDQSTIDMSSSAGSIEKMMDNGEEMDTTCLRDDEDGTLYSESLAFLAPTHRQSPIDLQGQEPLSSEGILYFSVCRQSGELEIYTVSSFSRSAGDETPKPIFRADACAQGEIVLENLQQNSAGPRAPRMHKVKVDEIRFFVSGPHNDPLTRSPTCFKKLMIALETSLGDQYVYIAKFSRGSIVFERMPLQRVNRQSKEQAKHHAKLRRKKMLPEEGEQNDRLLSRRLHRFHNVSGHDGLFSATSLPTWLLVHHGKPLVLNHRCRHAAPAGAKDRPVIGFCPWPAPTASGHDNLSLSFGSSCPPQMFMTLHERVGKVGSQRWTVFRGLFPDTTGADGLVATRHLFPGGGFVAEKIPLGVTVRSIRFMDDPSISTGDHPLYAVLVSREVNEDQSELNDDGMSDDERRRIAEEKEKEQIRRQVEADLGGFDVEQEWVEEIEREDCFQINGEVGGAPAMRKAAYSLWIVDAANRWEVVDSFELGENEHGLTMDFLRLSEFNEEPGVGAEEIEAAQYPERLFVAVGTALLDHNGEDVTSKGRALLFDVKKTKESSTDSSQVAELSLVYEKNIFHGPVTTLRSLDSDGRKRLIIGAGADINVEQWGNGSLLQVGFFRATMQILDVKIFKNFLLLSDAYDSLYFLVWRESDKSLTLLAKDYDPIAVYATGLLSRGGTMAFVAHDDRQNLQFFHYAPGDAASRGGNKLVCRADFHVGVQLSAMQNHFCRSSLLVDSATPESTLAALKQQDALFGRTDDDQRLGLHFGTSDGGLGSLSPVSEPVYWRLTALQSVMVNALESNGGLSQRAWRLYRRSPRRGGCRTHQRKKGVIDGDLVFRFVDLPLTHQEDLASSIGSSVDLIMDNILELACASWFM